MDRPNVQWIVLIPVHWICWKKIKPHRWHMWHVICLGERQPKRFVKRDFSSLGSFIDHFLSHNAIFQCAGIAGLDYNALNHCESSVRGIELQVQAERQTRRIKEPYPDFIPTIIFNKVSTVWVGHHWHVLSSETQYFWLYQSIDIRFEQSLSFDSQFQTSCLRRANRAERRHRITFARMFLNSDVADVQPRCHRRHQPKAEKCPFVRAKLQVSLR